MTPPIATLAPPRQPVMVTIGRRPSGGPVGALPAVRLKHPPGSEPAGRWVARGPVAKGV